MDSLEKIKRRLSTALENGQRMRRRELNHLQHSLVMDNPGRIILKPRQDALDGMIQRSYAAISRIQQSASNRLNLTTGLMRTLDPSSVVERGYAIVSQDRRIITRPGDIDMNKEFDLRMSGGIVRARGVKIEVNESDGQKKTDV